jgi:hypothetical protein
MESTHPIRQQRTGWLVLNTEAAVADRDAAHRLIELHHD